MFDKNSIYAELFHSYHRSLMNFCISQGVKEENASDIASEAFTRAIEKADQFLVLEPLQRKSWLYTAAGNIIKENRAKISHAVFSEIENIENYIKDNDELALFQSKEEFQAYTQLVYDKLPSDKDKELFRLIFDQKINYDVLSKKYETSPNAARMMVHRFRGKLHQIVNKILNF